MCSTLIHNRKIVVMEASAAVKLSLSAPLAEKLGFSPNDSVDIDSFLNSLRNAREANNGKPTITSFGQVTLSFPKKETKKVDAQLEERRDFLRLRQEEREYNRMIYGVDRNLQADEVLSKGSQFSSFQHQISMGVNVLFSKLAAFGMVYYLAKQWGFDEGKSMIIGLAAAIAVLVIEMLLYILRAVRLEQETERQATAEELNVAQFRSGSLVSDPKAVMKQKRIE